MSGIAALSLACAAWAQNPFSLPPSVILPLQTVM